MKSPQNQMFLAVRGAEWVSVSHLLISVSSEHCKYFPSPNTTLYHLETAWIKIGHHLGTTWTTHEHLKPLQLQEYQMGGRRLYKLGYCSVC